MKTIISLSSTEFVYGVVRVKQNEEWILGSGARATL